jgi:hypothetical protein
MSDAQLQQSVDNKREGGDEPASLDKGLTDIDI